MEKRILFLSAILQAILRFDILAPGNSVVKRMLVPVTPTIAVGILATILSATPAVAQFCDDDADCDDGIACTIDDCFNLGLLAFCRHTLDNVNCQIVGNSTDIGSSCSDSNDDAHSCLSSVTSSVSRVEPGFESRFRFGLCADGDGGQENSIRGTAQHKVTFKVKTPGKYRLEVRHGWAGDMQAEHRGLSGAGIGNVSDVTGSWSGPGSITPSFVGLADPGEAHVDGDVFPHHKRVDIDDSASFSITDTSNGQLRSHQLVFNWDGHARGVGDTIGAVRLGKGHWDSDYHSAHNNEKICKYPGDPDRSESNDGHTVFVEVVPLCGNSRIDTEVGESCDPTAPQADVCCTENCTLCCGNGIVDAGEECDPSAGGSSECCDASCQFRPSGTSCRPSAGACDVAESCTGSSATCPTDTFASVGTSCGGSDTDCDALDTCDGSGTCVDQVDPASTECRTATGACDRAESCDGSSATCPTDAVAAAGTSCRAANGACDVAESCDGSSTACPVDGFAAATTACRVAAGDCDIAEVCTGSSAECPTDAKSTALCRAADGACDRAESCDGSDANCPADGFTAADTLCRTSDDECGAAEYCTGTDAACPTDLAAADGTLCTDIDGEDCTLAACADGQCAQVYDTCLDTCRPPLFWSWHAGREKQGTDITLAVMKSAANARLMVCGETLDDTDKNSASSTVEALCLPTPKEGEISQLQLAKQLTAAKLNCLANGEEPECLSLISTCDTICQTPGASTASLAACIQDLNLLNEGLSLSAPECEQGVLLGRTSASPAGSTKKCADANKTSCTIAGTGETSCKAGTNNPD